MDQHPQRSPIALGLSAPPIAMIVFALIALVPNSDGVLEATRLTLVFVAWPALIFASFLLFKKRGAWILLSIPVAALLFLIHSAAALDYGSPPLACGLRPGWSAAPITSAERGRDWMLSRWFGADSNSCADPTMVEAPIGGTSNVPR